jgi:hypothetical protein
MTQELQHTSITKPVTEASVNLRVKGRQRVGPLLIFVLPASGIAKLRKSRVSVTNWARSQHLNRLRQSMDVLIRVICMGIGSYGI